MICDSIVVPPDQAAQYAPRPLPLDGLYQANDDGAPALAAVTRADEGLPHDALVLACFNNFYKITPEVFGAWMRILQQLPGSVLWLLADNPWAEANLRRESVARGVDPERLVFAGRVQPEDYLARYAVADLFLDCYPFNGGTTANDALWMGLPVLTRSGRTFASRMAGALLTAAVLPELITTDLAAYERRAIELARRPDELQRLRQHLQALRGGEGVLFDTPRFVRALEAGLLQLAGRDG
jgi:predicted O-linked N-acetylglucosamine transferase (SPINDLY family)